MALFPFALQMEHNGSAQTFRDQVGERSNRKRIEMNRRFGVAGNLRSISWLGKKNNLINTVAVQGGNPKALVDRKVKANKQTNKAELIQYAINRNRCVSFLLIFSFPGAQLLLVSTRDLSPSPAACNTLNPALLYEAKVMEVLDIANLFSDRLFSVLLNK